MHGDKEPAVVPPRLSGKSERALVILDSLPQRYPGRPRLVVQWNGSMDPKTPRIDVEAQVFFLHHGPVALSHLCLFRDHETTMMPLQNSPYGQACVDRSISTFLAAQ